MKGLFESYEKRVSDLLILPRSKKKYRKYHVAVGLVLLAVALTIC